MESSRRQTRADVLQEISRRLEEICLEHPMRVGIDGISASGKTVFADELAQILRDAEREVVRAGLDGFHNPPEIRHRLGPNSVEGYRRNSFDYSSVRRLVLDPLGPGGDLSYQTEIFDHLEGEPRETETKQASPQAILLFEGVMLFREELCNCFDYKILVHSSFEVALERAKVRDLRKFGSLEILLQKYTQRFFPGQKEYLEQSRPDKLADIVVKNDDCESPTICFGSKETQDKGQ